MHARKGLAEGAAVAAAAVAVAVTYGIYAVHPWQGSTPLNQFLAAFGRAGLGAERCTAQYGHRCRRGLRHARRGTGHRRMDHLAGPRLGPAWHTVTAGLLFALMIAWSGHDSVLIGLAVVLLAVMLVRAITGHLRRPHAARSTRPSRASSRSASHTQQRPRSRGRWRCSGSPPRPTRSCSDVTTWAGSARARSPTCSSWTATRTSGHPSPEGAGSLRAVMNGRQLPGIVRV